MELRVHFGADGGFLIKGRERELRAGPFPANRCEASFLPPTLHVAPIWGTLKASSSRFSLDILHPHPASQRLSKVWCQSPRRCPTVSSCQQSLGIGQSRGLCRGEGLASAPLEPKLHLHPPLLGPEQTLRPRCLSKVVVQCRMVVQNGELQDAMGQGNPHI